MTRVPGMIGTTVAESTPSWVTPAGHGSDSPNVVLIILDDTGWSDLGCYGSEIATPAIDSLASEGIRFNNFHVLPLCSPTRAAVLTGKNNHAIGMRFLADTDTGFPNSRGAIREDVETLPAILRDNGYGTYLVGKWHLAPLHEVTPAGPYQNWPLAKGFDRYYGFLDGCTDQYEPELYEDNHQLPTVSRPGYHLSEDLADKAIEMLTQHVTFRDGHPFFMQFALGATHAPFQAPKEYIDKYVDVFRKGWDKTREERLERQMSSGLVPRGTSLAERNEGVSAWDSLSQEQQDVYAHLQAAFAGFLEHADEQIGRVVEHLDRLGVRENTIVLVMSDNGASREGGPTGDIDTNAPYSGVRRPVSEQSPHLDELGGLLGGAHYPEGWAMAGNTPFRWYKQFVDLGGVRSPLVLSWPKGATAPDDVRTQFVHAVDIAPTLLDIMGIDAAGDMDGSSVAAAVTEPSSDVGRATQYWETLGHRAIWHEGWRAVSAHVLGEKYEDDVWRLYDAGSDFSEARDLALQHPEKLRQLQDLWWEEAASHDVFPLDDRPLRLLIEDRGPVGLFAQKKLEFWPDGTHVPLSSGVTGSNRNIDVIAHRRDGANWQDGVLLSSGNAQGGFVLHLVGGALLFEHSHLKVLSTVEGRVKNPRALSLGFRLETADDGSASVELFESGDRIGMGVVPQTSSHLSFQGMDIGVVRSTTFSTRVAAAGYQLTDMVEKITIEVSAEANDLDEYVTLLLGKE